MSPSTRIEDSKCANAWVWESGRGQGQEEPGQLRSSWRLLELAVPSRQVMMMGFRASRHISAPKSEQVSVALASGSLEFQLSKQASRCDRREMEGGGQIAYLPAPASCDAV
jgi:hypothetical protein